MAVVLGLFTTMAAVVMIGCVGCRRDRLDTARLDISAIGNALKVYRARTGRYPTTQEGLCALVRRRMFKKLPRDPWNAEYQYALWRGLPRIWTYGADNAPGGEGADADVYNASILPPWLYEQGPAPIESIPSAGPCR